MPKRKNDPTLQPNLLAEPQAEYQPTPEEFAEKERYRQRLAEYLKDPAFRQIEGFPIGEDEAILALSDPPYYTACPNPFLGEIVEKWQRQRAELRRQLGLPDDSYDNGSPLPGLGDGSGMKDQNHPSPPVGGGTGVRVYHREPFAADVSEGKNDPIYNAHSYHTKVPHKAIMRYILHYTDPGDIVFDGFCGTGMTGVAAQLCGDKKAVESLGYYVDRDGWIYEGRPSHPHPPAPSPTRGEGEPMSDQWDVPIELRRKMVEVARQFRKQPTASEALLWNALRGKKLSGVKFRRQQPIGPFVVDFFAPSHRLIIEVDGPIHADQQQLDQQRQALIESLGLKVMRLPAELVEQNLPEALRRIEDALQTSLPSPLVGAGLGAAGKTPPSPLVGAGLGAASNTPPSPLVGEGMGVRGQKPISRLGARKAVLVDLSPAATFIAYNYNTPVDARAFEREARRILKEVEDECGWMYETWHPHCDDPNRVKGKINYTVWSDVFLCPQCGGEMAFWDVAVDHEKGAVREDWDCPRCNARLSKSPKKGSGAVRAERAFETHYDRALGQTVRMAKQVPVLINYSLGKKRYEKRPDADDLTLLEKIEQGEIPYTFPTYPMMFKGGEWGDTWRAGVHAGLTHVHHFYTRRNLWALAAIISKLPINSPLHMTWFTSALIRTSKMYKFTLDRKMGNVMGTLYVPSINVENNPSKLLHSKTRDFSKIQAGRDRDAGVSCQSSTSLLLETQTIDYLFVDPPFGANLMYSELNFLWEAWLGVFTNNQPEAVVNKTQRKGLPEYQALMEACFREFYRLLKPGRWMTVEFHNSQNSVWNAIQEAILQAGFMVADVRTLDKQQGTFKQVTTTAAVKQDLIISAYKPRTAFERQFLSEGGSAQGAWAFIRQHLEQLPLPAVENGVVETLTERQAYLLYDRMVAYHLVRGLSVPLSSPEFYQGLAQRFLERDGMYFTPAQAAEYDKLRLKAERVEQLALFVTDEKSAVQWLRQALDPSLGGQPQTYQELQPKFIQQLHQARHEKLPELRQMLEENFLQDEAGRWYNPNPERKADLEALRQRTLLREYKEYLKGKGRLKIFRSEAVRAGFSADWKERNYADIVQIAERLPENVLQEDQGLLMYYHNASLRLAEKPKQERLF